MWWFANRLEQALMTIFLSFALSFFFIQQWILMHLFKCDCVMLRGLFLTKQVVLAHSVLYLLHGSWMLLICKIRIRGF